MEGGEKGWVCVTGGTGYVASWLIMRLLQHGYSVRTTVRSDPGPENKKDLKFLTNLPGASENLKIFTADLSNPDSFIASIEGCIGVFHVATPVDFEGREPEEIVTKRTIDGTLAILNLCLNSKTVRRVVYTSSLFAVHCNPSDEEIMDENFWSDVNFIREFKPFGDFGPYSISKTLAEKAALEFGDKYGLDVVTVNPSFIVGPFICPKLPSSVRTSIAMILGEHDQYKYLKNTSMVHIDDVASAHIFLFEHPNAKGRYICSSNIITLEEMSEFLSTKYPEFQIPTFDSLKDIKGYKMAGLSSKKLLDSGFKYKYGLHEMFDGAIGCSKEKGYL